MPRSDRPVWAEISACLTLRDRLFIDELRGAGRFVSDADLLRTALVNQARLMGVDVPRDVLRLRNRPDPRRRSR